MLTQDHLTLKLIRLKPAEEWQSKEQALYFVFPKEIAGKCTVGTTTQRLEPGDVLILNLQEAKLRSSEKGEMVFFVFSLRFEHLLPLFASNEICLLQTVTDRFKGGKLYHATAVVAKDCHRLIGEVPPQFNLDHRSQLLRIAAAVLTEEFKSAQPQRVGFVRAEEHMIQVFEKLSTIELLNLSVGDLADKFGCSRRHLNRLFHQHFGVSVASLRMEMRLLKAVSLLRDPDAKIINVAEECGFNHLGLFNTCFKKRFGASPGQWRKQNMEAHMPARGKAGPVMSAEADPACPLRVNGLCPWSGKSDSPPPPALMPFGLKVQENCLNRPELPENGARTQELIFGTEDKTPAPTRAPL